MFGKMMNRYYYGKAGKGDFTPENLPQTRWQLFWDTLRVRFTALFKLNLIYLIGWLPAVIVIGRGILYALNALGSTPQLQEQVAAGEMTAEQLQEIVTSIPAYLQTILSQSLLLLIPCMAWKGLFTPGCAYVTRNWARDEHAFVLSDFKDAVKSNWKYGLITGIITGLVPIMLYVCVTFYGQMAAGSWFYIIPQMLCLIMGILWMCALLYIYPQMVTYTLDYKGLLRNSLIMAVGRLPQTVGLKLLSLVPTFILLLFMFFTPWAIYALLVYAVYYVFLGFALSRFVTASYTNAVFDRYINPRIEGAEVNRGLYVEEDDDEDEEEEEETSSEN